ncbi:MAG: hypothetical protein HY898_10005 [Deltaproteobacteria bacterium]|nr:hypothetical protein [Deltaproteobacteria bacterium]
MADHLCETCEAPTTPDAARCEVCVGFDAVGAAVPAGVEARAFLCQVCGAPGCVLPGQPPPGCAVCGKEIELAPRNIAFQPVPVQHDPGWSLRAEGRRQRLKSQQHGRKGSFYDLTAVPPGLEELHQAGTHDAKVGALLARAFADARKALPSQRARVDGGGYREHAGQLTAPPMLQKTLIWIASRAVSLYAHLKAPTRARPFVEQALVLVSDPGLRNLALCQLAGLARGAGAFNEAEQWLGACAPEPVDVELDSAWRVIRCHLLADRGSWAAVTETLGASIDDIPASLQHYVAMGLLRIASHENQSRMDSADKEFLRLNEIALDADIEDCLLREPRLDICRDVIRRYRDELVRKEAEHRKAELRLGLIAGAAGIAALLLCPLIVWSGRSTTLSCDRPEPPSASSQPQCTIMRSIAGSEVERLDVQDLRGAEVLESGSSNKRNYTIELTHGRGKMELTPSSCQRCGGETRGRAQRINAYLKDPAVRSLRETSSDLGATLLGVVMGFGALGLLAYALLKVAHSLTGRPSSSSD